MRAFSSWIDLDCKLHYLDSSKRGLRIIVGKGVCQKRATLVKEYLRFLRKRYFFPIRCYFHLTNQARYSSAAGGYCYGVFFPGEENRNGLPSIYYPALAENDDWECVFDVARLLTYYFQWYFGLEGDRSHRSLEAEAARMAGFLADEFLVSRAHPPKEP